MSVPSDLPAEERELTLDGPTLIEPSDEDGFNYPYYLAVPDSVTDPPVQGIASLDGGRPILVAPHNIGEIVEDYQRHLELARRRITKQSSRSIASELGIPILIPVFPRPFEDPVDWTHMIHMLCARTMQIDSGPLERVDLQLLAMIDDAQARLASLDIPTRDSVILNGFSSQAAFVNRFASLHPHRVDAVSAGGINGLAILPREYTKIRGFGERLMKYPVGVGNIEDLTGTPFDHEAFRKTPQFIYMGSEDDKDALLYPDAWTEPELRAIAVLTYGDDIHDERFPYCKSVYQDEDVNAVFRVYDGVGHTPEPALDDIVAFHKRALAGESTDSIRADLGGNVS